MDNIDFDLLNEDTDFIGGFPVSVFSYSSGNNDERETLSITFKDSNIVVEVSGYNNFVNGYRTNTDWMNWEIEQK